MKKFYFLTAVFLSALLSSCSMLSKNEKQEISVTLDTKPLANYAKILFSEVTTQDNPVQRPSNDQEPEESFFDKSILNINDYFDSFSINLSLSGDFTETIKKEETISFDDLLETPEKISFKFDNLEYIPGTKAKITAEIFPIRTEQSEGRPDIFISNSMFYAENEQDLAAGPNKISLSMDYTKGIWPEDGVLSLLPEMDDFWFYIYENDAEYNIKSFSVFRNNTDWDIYDYVNPITELITSEKFHEAVYNLYKADEYEDFDCYPYTFDLGFNFSIITKKDEPIPETKSYIANYIFGEHSNNSDISGIPYDSQTIILPNMDFNPKEGYEFAGWYLDEEFKDGPYEEYTYIDEETEKAFYAKWENVEKENVTPTFKYQFQDPETDYIFSLQDQEINSFRTENIVAFPSAFFNLEYLVQFIDPMDGEIVGEFPPDESITQGTYNLKVKAVYEDLILTKEINDFIISKDFTEPYIITFLPDESSPEKGNINLNFEDKSTVFANYSADLSGSYITEHSGAKEWICENVTPGSYKTHFDFYDTENKTINTVNDISVLVWPGFTTDSFFGPENLVNNENKLIIEASEEYKETHPEGSNPVTTKPRDILVGPGSEYETITAAFNAIKVSDPGEYNLIVSGYSELNEDFSEFSFDSGTYISFDFTESSFDTIPKDCFRNFAAIDKVKLPTSVQTIESYAFEYSGLSEIDLGGTTKINNNAFSKCYLLTSLTIPSSVTYIQQYAFMECSMLDSVVIEGVIETWGEGVFEDCSSLQKVYLTSDTAYALGKDIMTGCSNGYCFVVKSEEIKSEFEAIAQNKDYVFIVE